MTITLDQQGEKLHGRKANFSVATRCKENQQTGTPELTFPVTVTGHKINFGRLRLRIEPVDGAGHWWVDSTSTKLELLK